MKFHAWILAALASTCACPIASGGSPPTFPHWLELGHDVTTLTGAAGGRFAVVDPDGDGIADLVFAGETQSSILMTLGRKADGSFGFKQATPLPDDGGNVRALGWMSNGSTHVLTVGANGTVRDFSGWPLAQARQFNVITNARAAAIGDVDGNGSDDLLILSDSDLRAYSLADGQALWVASGSGGTDLALAQLDADPALEIIIAGAVPGVVLDGATRAVDWQYIDGFGTRLATGALGDDGTTHWVAAQGWYQYTIFRASPWSPLWGGSTNIDIGALATAHLDADPNARDVILIGDGQWGAVHAIDATTHQQRFEIPNQGYSVRAIAGGDLDGDGIPEIAFASGSTYNGRLLDVADGRSGESKWNYAPGSSPLYTTSIGDLDGDGLLEVMAGTRMDSGFTHDKQVLDLQSGAVRWQSPPSYNANEAFNMTTSRIRQIAHDGAPGADIVIGGTSSGGGRLLVLDGSDMSVKLQVGDYSTIRPMDSRNLVDFQLLDLDADGTLDFVAATAPYSSGASGALLSVFSGVDGHLLWNSPPMGTGFTQINTVLLGPAPSGGAGVEMIAVLPGSLRAYNSQTLLLDWVLAATNDGASFIEHGIAGPEIAVFLEGGAITFYDARTRAYLRSWTLPAPVRAITALDGDIHQLLVSSADRLVLVDGNDGQMAASTDYMGGQVALGNQIALAGSVHSDWSVAATSDLALYRFKLRLLDRIFFDTFETP